jgi:Protein kinase domain
VSYSDKLQRKFAVRYESSRDVWVQSIENAKSVWREVEKLIQRQTTERENYLLQFFLSEIMNGQRKTIQIQDSETTLKARTRLETDKVVLNLNSDGAFFEKLKADEMINKMAGGYSGPAEINLRSFDIIQKIGQGSFGEVHIVRLKGRQKLYAMKTLNKDEVHRQGLMKYAIIEANIMKKANHPFIMPLHFAFQVF